MEFSLISPRFRFLSALLIGCLLSASGIAAAEQTLADADWFERPLGQGVVWRHYLFDDLYGQHQSISYLDVDLNDPTISIDFPYRANAREVISSMIPSQYPDAVAGINGTYFNTRIGGHATYLRVDGNVIPPTDGFAAWGKEGALALDGSGGASMQLMPSGGWDEDTIHPDIIACGPMVVIESVIPTEQFTAIGPHCTGRHPRSAVGLTADNHLILLAADGRSEMAAGMTCEEVGETMEALGCVDALNLDGGGSTVLWGRGEPHKGVINYPSDNGAYDHDGERSCANAIAVMALPPTPKELDGRLLTKSFSDKMRTNSTQTVTLVYENNGTTPWSAADVHLVLARPTSRTSIFYDSETWPSESEPAAMMPAMVAPGEQGTFSFVVKSPEVANTTVYHEHFMLTKNGVGRFGPADSEAWMKFVVQPPVPPGESFIVESRPGGQNLGWYSDDGMDNSGADTGAPGCTTGIGSRWGSTYRSIAGLKRATAAPDFPKAGYYNVSVAWGAGSNRHGPITYHVNYPGGTSTYQLDQSSVSDVWMQLGSAPFYFNEGLNGDVVMTNEDIDQSGSMYAGAFRFQYLQFAAPEKSYDVQYLDAELTGPTIDGHIDGAEWNDASAAATGFVFHDNIANPAAEPGSFRVLYDDNAMYILFQLDNGYLPGFSTPAQPAAYADLTGDRINFFLTPGGVASEPFYRIMLCPNRTDGKCYIWSQANLLRTTNSAVGSDWIAGGEAAFSYSGNKLVIEYRVPWSAFNRAGMAITGAPANGTTWGLQAALTNEVSGADWDYVNWEPDETPSYVLGNPYGALNFVHSQPNAVSWKIN